MDNIPRLMAASHRPCGGVGVAVTGGKTCNDDPNYMVALWRGLAVIGHAINDSIHMVALLRGRGKVDKI